METDNERANAIANGGPAFPVPTNLRFDSAKDSLTWREKYAGMSLRDYFAARAMARFNWGDKKKDRESAAHCYSIADAMLAARAFPPEQQDGGGK